jgi:hypothetical protein
MILRPSKALRWMTFVGLTLSFLACGLTVQTSNNVVKMPTSSASARFETGAAGIQGSITPTYTMTPAVPTIAATASPTFPLVTITAINGNLYIRRGSGSDFNPIGALLEGQTAKAYGRDILDEWLYIPIPSQTGKFGWVSTLTIYSSISGQPMDLPVVDSALAVPAFIQNCSIHNMIVWPVGVIIPPVNDYPDNIVQFDPGKYLVQDYDNGKSNPNGNQGTVVDLKEGEQFRLTALGTAAGHKCPEGQ